MIEPNVFWKSIRQRTFQRVVVMTAGLLIGCMPISRSPMWEANTAWSHVSVGSQVFLGSDNPPLGDRAQAVCPSPAAYMKWTVSGKLGACHAVMHGAMGYIEKLVPRGPAVRYPMALIRAADRSWIGYAALNLLQPKISIGTVLRMDGAFGTPPQLTVAVRPTRKLNLPKGTYVRVVKYEPHKFQSLFVRALDGPDRGRTGWIDPASAAGAILGRYGCCSF